MGYSIPRAKVFKIPADDPAPRNTTIDSTRRRFRRLRRLEFSTTARRWSDTTECEANSSGESWLRGYKHEGDAPVYGRHEAGGGRARLIGVLRRSTYTAVAGCTSTPEGITEWEG